MILLCSAVQARANGPALWEYGVGFGAIQYSAYPASDQNGYLFLPFPTFQYRGETLRADDREGARAYLLKEQNLSLQLSGLVLPAEKSADSDARRGMPALPWMISLGPQIVDLLRSDFELKVGIYQAIATDFSLTEFNGIISELKLSYLWSGAAQRFYGIEKGRWDGHLSLTLLAADQQFLSTYFSVDPNQARAQRPTYQARSGFLSDELSVFQAFHTGRVTLYVGGGLTDYSHSANRQSALHKADTNFSCFTGLTYVLGESTRSAVPESDTEGILNHRFH